MNLNEIINNTITEYLNNNNSNNNLILYHGTKNKFDNFDLKFFNSATADGGWLGYGIYLTNDYEYAESYGDVLECKVNIENPYILTDSLYSTRPVKLKNELNANNAKEITLKLKNNGYDSVLLKYSDDSWLNEFIELNVFNPNNITIINRYKQWDNSNEIKQKKGYINENINNKIFLGYHSSKRDMINGYYKSSVLNPSDYSEVIKNAYFEIISDYDEFLENNDIEAMNNVFNINGYGFTFVSDKPISGSAFQSSKYKYDDYLYKVYGDGNEILLDDVNEINATIVVSKKPLYFEKISNQNN